MNRLGIVSVLACGVLSVVAFSQAPGAAVPVPAMASGAIVPGELLIEPPTLINLGFEWFVQGDPNRNAAVEVSYRKKGHA